MATTLDSRPPDLSIVICTRNRAGQLRGTLDSLMAMKTNRPWEAILVDNGSTDGTADVIHRAAEAEPRIRYVREDKTGLGPARDCGWRTARAGILSWTDDDCYLAEDYVDSVLAAFDDRPDVGVVGGRILLFDPDDARVTIDERDYPVEIAPRTFVEAGAFKGANLSFRREALAAIGGFDHEFGVGGAFPGGDIDAVSSALWQGFKARYDPRPTVHHHHRRRLPDVPRLRAGYDRGRGAYYAKFLLRPECRRAFALGWLGQLRKNLTAAGLVSFARELRSAATYLRRHGKTASLVALALPAVALYAMAAVAAGAKALLRPLRPSRHWLQAP